MDKKDLKGFAETYPLTNNLATNASFWITTESYSWKLHNKLRDLLIIIKYIFDQLDNLQLVAYKAEAMWAKLLERELELHDSHEQFWSEKSAWTDEDNVLLRRLLKFPRSHLSLEHPDPTPFDGNNSNKLIAFIIDLKIKLKQNNVRWPDE